MDSKQIARHKREHRRRIRARIEALAPADRETASRRLREVLAEVIRAEADPGASVLLFAALHDEPDIAGIMDDLPGHRWLLPRVVGPAGERRLHLHRIEDGNRLVAGRWGIAEPDPGQCPRVEPGEIDLALMPGVAFVEETGDRLGRGGGFYDTLLAGATWRARTLGVCFACQLVPFLPAEPHDLRVDRVLAA